MPSPLLLFPSTSISRATRRLRAKQRASRNSRARRSGRLPCKDEVVFLRLRLADVDFDIAARVALEYGQISSASSPSVCARSRSTCGDFDDGFRKGLRSFLRQIVSDAALDRPMRISAREFLRVGLRLRMRGSVGIPFKGDGRHRDDRARGKAPFQVVIFTLAFSEAQPPSIVMDDNVDMNRVIEGRSGAIECRIVEVPLGRSELPNELGKVVPVFFVAGPAALRGKIELVPPL